MRSCFILFTDIEILTEKIQATSSDYFKIYCKYINNIQQVPFTLKHTVTNLGKHFKHLSDKINRHEQHKIIE